MSVMPSGPGHSATHGRDLVRVARRVGFWLGLGAIGIGLGLASYAIGAGASASTTSRATGYEGAYPGMLGGYGAMGGLPRMMGGYGMMGGYAGTGVQTGTRSVAMRSADTAANVVPAGAVVDRAANRVRFTTARVKLSVVASPPGTRALSFRIAGLTNPTVVVPAWARVTMTFINADEGLPHDFVLTAQRPPYGTVGATPAVAGAAVPVLVAASATAARESVSSFVAPASGTLHYVCSVAGHAAAGMFGVFQVAG